MMGGGRGGGGGKKIEASTSTSSKGRFAWSQPMCEKSPPPYEVSLIWIFFPPLEFVPYRFHFWWILKKSLKPYS